MQAELRTNASHFSVLPAWIWAALLTLFASTAFAADPADSVCRVAINARGAEGTFTNGLSGVVVGIEGDRVFVMTNSHGFRDVVSVDSITVYPPSHPPISCDKVEYRGNADDKLDDIAVISGPSKSPPPSAELSDRSPQPGDVVQLVGYPKGGPIDVRSGRRTDVTLDGGGDHFDMPSEDGMSGGPIYLAGRFCSLNWGGGGPEQDSYGVPLPRIRAVLQRVFGREPLATDQYLTAQQCSGPSCGVEYIIPTDGQCVGPGCAVPMDLRPMAPPALPMDGFRGNAQPPRVVQADPWRPANTPRQPMPSLQPPANAAPVAPLRNLQVREPVHDVLAADQRGLVPEQPITKLEPVKPVAADAIATVDAEPVPPTEDGFDWSKLAMQSVIAASGVVGFGVPTWLVLAWRGARAARQVRESIGRRRSAEPVDFRRLLAATARQLQPLRCAIAC